MAEPELPEPGDICTVESSTSKPLSSEFYVETLDSEKKEVGGWNHGAWAKFSYGHVFKRQSKLDPQRITDHPFARGFGGFLIGADPEVFISDAGGNLIPAWEFLPDKASGSWVHWDGFQAEFKTNAIHCLDYHTGNLGRGLMTLLVRANGRSQGARILPQSVVQVPANLLLSATEEQVALGCDPSLNAYGHSGQVVYGRTLSQRFAGGHIHFGLPGLRPPAAQYRKLAIQAVKALDALVGVAAVCIAQNYDDPIRRQYYGLAGEYRLPKHGLEYRTLSNFWLMHPSLPYLVFDLARLALRVGMYNLLPSFNLPEIEVVEAINTLNVKLARALVKRNKEWYWHVFNSLYGSSSTAISWRCITEGMESVSIDPLKVMENWNFYEVLAYDKVPTTTRWMVWCQND